MIKISACLNCPEQLQVKLHTEFPLTTHYNKCRAFGFMCSIILRTQSTGNVDMRYLIFFNAH